MLHFGYTSIPCHWGNGGEELIDGNTATLPWCALAMREGFQAGKCMQIMHPRLRSKFSRGDDGDECLKPHVQVATDMHLVMLSCCVFPTIMVLFHCHPPNEWISGIDNYSTVIWCILNFFRNLSPLPAYPRVSIPNQIQPSQFHLTSQQLQFEERPSREAMLAILYFLYTGKTSRVNGSTAMDVLCLLGAEGVGWGKGVGFRWWMIFLLRYG